MGIRRAGDMHHLDTAHARRRVIALGDTITVIDLLIGEVLSTHLIEPDRTYWRNQNKEPRPMAGLRESVTYVPTQVSPMSRLITRRQVRDSKPYYVPYGRQPDTGRYIYELVIGEAQQFVGPCFHCRQRGEVLALWMNVSDLYDDPRGSQSEAACVEVDRKAAREWLIIDQSQQEAIDHYGARWQSAEPWAVK